MTQSILIPAPAFDSTFKRLSRLAKKAGVALDLIQGQSRIYRRVYETRLGANGSYRVLVVDSSQALPCSRVTVGDLPCTNGYQFVGKITHTEAGNLLALGSASRSEEIPADWRDAKPTCDHCSTSRSRKDTFLIRTPSGDLRRVGRNCLADFLMSDPAGMIALSEFQEVLREVSETDPEDRSGGGSWSWQTTPLHFLACAFSSVASSGFVSRAAAEGGLTATSDDAMFLAQPLPGSCRDNIAADWKARQPTPDHSAQSVAALLWLKEQDSTSSNYLHNLKVGIQMQTVGRENAGLIASLPSAYARAMGLVAEKKAREALPDAGYIGTVGERVETRAIITRVSTVESSSRFVAAYDLIAFRTEAGHECVTFSTSAKAPRLADVGKTFNVRGTVKKQEEYKGRKNTQLSRCVWTEEP